MSSDNDLYSSIDIIYSDPGPTLGDLIELCGQSSSRFLPSGSFGFARLDYLQFTQVDDYFGVRALSTGGVVIWLYPLVQGQVVEQHPGPFSGIRLQYDCDLNTPGRAAHFGQTVRALANAATSSVVWTENGATAPTEPEQVVQQLSQRCGQHR